MAHSFYTIYFNFEEFFTAIWKFDPNGPSMEFTWIMTYLVNVIGIFLFSLIFYCFYALSKRLTNHNNNQEFKQDIQDSKEVSNDFASELSFQNTNS